MRLQFSLNATITPQLSLQVIQRLNILQLTTIGLIKLIQEKFLENPLIDVVESTIEKLYDWLKLASVKGSGYILNNEPLFNISHRTVAKDRQQLHIPSSKKRGISNKMYRRRSMYASY